MIKWLTTDDETKRRAYTQLAENTGMSPFAAEKDWWVVQTLSIVFEMDVAKHLVFKGGTSLSKAWKIIERFSEDIDIAIDRGFFGYGGDLNNKQIEKLRKEAGSYIDDVFFPTFQLKAKERGLIGINLELVSGKRSDRDRQINIHYPHVIAPPGYLKPRVQIEFSCRSLKEPFTMKKFSSLLDENYPEQEFVLPAISVPTVNPERTFLEKLFLLHEEFQRPLDRIRSGDRLSRHLYDVVKLSKTGFSEKALTDAELYFTIVEHRQKFNLITGVNYNMHQPQTINPIPTVEVIKAWKEDYNTMIEQMIYEQEPPSFEQVIEELNQLKKRINNLTWRFQKEF